MPNSPTPAGRPVRRRTRSFLVLFLVPLVAALGACGEVADDEGAASSTTAGSEGGWGDGAGARDGAPTITRPTGDAPEELQVTDLTEGDGAELVEGQIAVVDYTGATFSDGEVFDASYGGQPFSLTVGAGQVIPGWDQGLVGMRVGGRRQLVIPPDLAYGASGSGPIGPDETLIFLVDLRAALTRPKPQPAPDPTGSLEIVDVTVGTGDRTVEAGDTVSVHYVGVLAESGEEFDASWNSGQAFSFTVGSGQVIEGWDQGLVGMAVGGRRRLVIPPDLAYGPNGQGPIGPNATLVFEIDLVSITPG